MTEPHVKKWHNEAAEAAVMAILSVAKKRDMQSMVSSDITAILAGMAEAMTLQNYGMIAEITRAIHTAAKEQLDGPDNAS